MKPRAHLYELRLGFVSRDGPVILGASCLGGPCWRPEGGDESRRRGSLEAAVLGRIRIRYSPRSSLRSLASFPPSIHQAVNLECHLAGGRSRHLSLSTCRWHIDARRPLVPSSDPPFTPPPARQPSSAQRLVQQILSSKITVPRAAIGQRSGRGGSRFISRRTTFHFLGLITGWTEMARVREGDNCGFKH